MPDLVEACISGDVSAVEQILATDPSCVDARDPMIGATPLIFAAHRGHAAVVDRLLAAGAAVDGRERVSNTTALHWASEGGHPGVIESLLAAGATLDVVDEWFGLGPLGWATAIEWCRERWVDRAGAVALLLARGAVVDAFAALALGRHHDVDVTARLGFVGRGRRPLHVAVREYPDAVPALLGRGADPHAPDDRGVTALAEAIAAGRRALFATELSLDPAARLASGQPVGERVPGLLAWAAELGLADGVRELLALGTPADERVRGLSGEIPSSITPLHVAAEAGHIEVAAILLDGGADIDARADDTDQTALHRAVVGCQPEMVRLLLARGADAAITDRQHGATARGWAGYGGDAAVIAAFG